MGENTIMARLAEHFPKEVVKTKPGRGGAPAMSYISHALVTQRLNEVDPAWEVFTVDTHTYMGADGALHCAGVTISMSVNGVTRHEAGGPQRQDGFTNEIKNAHSDAIKRAAMRFGVALYIWDNLVDAEFDEDVHPEYGEREPTPMEPRQRAQVDAAHEEIEAARAMYPEIAAARRKAAPDFGDSGYPAVSRQHGVNNMADLLTYLQQHGFNVPSGRKADAIRELEQTFKADIRPAHGRRETDGSPTIFPGDIYDFAAFHISRQEAQPLALEQ